MLIELNLDNITNSQFPGFVRILAMEIKSRGYIAPSEFFKKISDSDLQALLGIAKEYEKGENGNIEATKILMVLTLLLSLGEGAIHERDKIDQIVQYVHYTIAFAICEHLGRMKAIEVLYSGFTYEPNCNMQIARSLTQPNPSDGI